MDVDDIGDLIDMLSMEMDQTIDHLGTSLAKIRTGKVAPSLVSGVTVQYYGAPTPITQVASISTLDSKTLSIKPFDKSAIGDIEQGIFKANLGLTPQNNGETIMIIVPPLTEERRMQLVKQAKAEGEDAKVSLRNVRQKAMDMVKKEVKDGYPEDAGKRLEGQVQDKTNEYGNKVDAMVDAKEKDIMTI